MRGGADDGGGYDEGDDMSQHMTSIADAALADIIANPHDDTPRLIFADWLDEHGEPERAEFIRVQCELAKHPCGDEARHAIPGCCCERCEPGFHCPQCLDLARKEIALRNRESKLLKTHGAQWAFPPDYEIPLSIGGFTFTWSRGFVVGVEFTWENWQAHGPAVVRAQPVERVVLVGIKPAEVPELNEFSFDDFGCLGNYAWFLPTELIGLMNDWKRKMSADDGGNYIAYPTEQAALDALSDAAIKWARQQTAQ